jgi:hypothetical protein
MKCNTYADDNPLVFNDINELHNHVFRNLTSSGLIGNIAPAISNLKSIEYL